MIMEPLDLEMRVVQDGYAFVIEANGVTFTVDCEEGEWWLRDCSANDGEVMSVFRIRKGKKFALLKAIDLVLGHLANDNLMVEAVA